MTINDSTFGNRKLLLGQNSGFEMQSQSVNQKEHGRWIDRTANIGTELRSLNTKKLLELHIALNYKDFCHLLHENVDAPDKVVGIFDFVFRVDEDYFLKFLSLEDVDV